MAASLKVLNVAINHRQVTLRLTLFKIEPTSLVKSDVFINYYLCALHINKGIWLCSSHLGTGQILDCPSRVTGSKPTLRYS